MDEQATFETRAVLGPRRARRGRVLLAAPLLMLVAVAWTGLSSHNEDRSTADAALPTAVPATIAPATIAPEPAFPAEVIGLGVRRVGDVLPLMVGPDDVVVVAGWYVPTAIDDCPRVRLTDPDRALAAFEHVPDPEAFCDRSGVLFDSRPVESGPFGSTGFPVLTTAVVHGVEMPPALEIVGADAMQVVVIGRLVPGVPGCERKDGCSRQLLVDHVAWTPG